MKFHLCGAILLFTALSSPAQARFLQTDPIGYEDQVNLYAYVNNDPLNQIDPTGHDAIVIVRENGDVKIILPMTFSGDAATDRNISTAINNIESTFSGTFDGTNVTTTVVNGMSPIDPSVRNSMAITSGNTPRVDPTGGSQGHSFVRNGTEGYITTKDLNGTSISQPNGTMTVGDKGINTYGHEGGHYMGLDDAKTGSGIMAPGSGTGVTGGDINQISRTSTATSINTVIRCPDERCQ